MFKSFTIVALAGIASAAELQSYSASYREGRVPYSTSYKGTATTSCYIAPYRPEEIYRKRLGSKKRGVGQYRSVNWGDAGCYGSYRDIDVLDQPAAYEKPSFTTTLIKPNQIYNSYENQSYHGNYGGYDGVMRRSEGVDYNQRIFKRTGCNGLRKDTKSTEYIHTDAPSTCTSQYVEPKPYQCYEGYEDYRTVEGASGAKTVGYDKPLKYPTYASKTYYYEKPVIQQYEVTKSTKCNPDYVEYHAPQYNFYEYEPEAPVKVLPTYYKAPKVYGEEAYGYIEEPEYYEEDHYPVAYGDEYYDDYHVEPMYVKERYPKERVQTYDKQVVKRTKLQPSRYKSAPVDHDLVPAYEKAQYRKPRYSAPRPKKESYGHDVREHSYAPKSRQYKSYERYAKPTYKSVQTKYAPSYTKAPVNYDYKLGCTSCHAY